MTYDPETLAVNRRRESVEVHLHPYAPHVYTIFWSLVQVGKIKIEQFDEEAAKIMGHDDQPHWLWISQNSYVGRMILMLASAVEHVITISDEEPETLVEWFNMQADVWYFG